MDLQPLQVLQTDSRAVGSFSLSEAHSSDLLALPAKLRNQIYTYHLSYITTALWPGNIIHIDTSSGRIPYGCKMPPLLQTCRQIRNEAVGILVDSRVFVLFGFGRVKRNIHLGWFEPYLAYMRRVELRRWMSSTGYRLEWKDGESLEGYELRAPTSCMPLVMRRSVRVLDQIVDMSKERGTKPALNSVGLTKLCEAIVKDEEEREVGF